MLWVPSRQAVLDSGEGTPPGSNWGQKIITGRKTRGMKSWLFSHFSPTSLEPQAHRAGLSKAGIMASARHPGANRLPCASVQDLDALTRASDSASSGWRFQPQTRGWAAAVDFCLRKPPFYVTLFRVNLLEGVWFNFFLRRNASDRVSPPRGEWWPCHSQPGCKRSSSVS